MRIIVLVTVLLFSACKKKDEAKPAATTDKQVEADPAKPAGLAQPGQVPAAPIGAVAPGGAAIPNAAAYEQKAFELTDRLLAIFVAGGKNCDKLAADITTFAGEHRATLEAMKAFEKANPGAEQALDDKMNSRDKEFEQKLAPAFEACKDHEGLRKAMDSLPMN